MIRVKGHGRRKISEPGYHLTSQYDLSELRKRQEKKKHKKSEPALPLTALIDIFSMLVIFLLMNFSTTGDIFFMSKEGIKLPVAGKTLALTNSPLISVTNQLVMLDFPGIQPMRLPLPIEGQTYQKFQNKIQELKAFAAKGGLGPDVKEIRINIQADQQTPVLAVKKVMNMLISEGLGDISFAVLHDEKKN